MALNSILSFRSGINDCPDGRPSDYFWSMVCNAAKLPGVITIQCYWLED